MRRFAQIGDATKILKRIGTMVSPVAIIRADTSSVLKRGSGQRAGAAVDKPGTKSVAGWESITVSPNRLS